MSSLRTARSAAVVLCVGLSLGLSVGCSAVGVSVRPESSPSRPPSVSPTPTPTPVPEPTAASSPAPTLTPTPTPSPTPGATPSSSPATGSASEALAALVVQGSAARTGYDRDLFHWRSDVDRNGCDTRNDVLRRDLRSALFEEGTRGCVVLSGTLPDPYGGEVLRMVRGGGDGIDVDHVVALGNAWVSGAARWSEEQRTRFGNDPLNLLAVSASQNRQKGDGDAATWLPASKTFRCAYVARQVAVKTRYALAVKPAERVAIERVLSGCPGQPLPTPAQVTPPPTDPRAPVGQPPTPAPGPGSGAAAWSAPYVNCDAARAAGAAPVHRGDPGYASHLDRDGDGTGCDS